MNYFLEKILVEKSYRFTDGVVCLHAFCTLKRDIFADSNFGYFPNFVRCFLTLSCPMFPFDPPENIRKPLVLEHWEEKG